MSERMIGFTTVIIWLAFLAFWGWRETVEHKACLQSGGDVVLGWLQDGCTTRKATP